MTDWWDKLLNYSFLLAIEDRRLQIEIEMNANSNVHKYDSNLGTKPLYIIMFSPLILKLRDCWSSQKDFLHCLSKQCKNDCSENLSCLPFYGIYYAIITQKYVIVSLVFSVHFDVWSLMRACVIFFEPRVSLSFGDLFCCNAVGVT